ncbi:unnamed protein product [Penicillium bialowiezense]
MPDQSVNLPDRDSLARHYATIHQSNPQRRDATGTRRRISQACKPCNLSKVRCDGGQPCRRCEKNHTDCHYEASGKRKAAEPSIPTEDSRNATPVESCREKGEIQPPKLQKRARIPATEFLPAQAPFQPNQHQATPETLEGISDNGPFDASPSAMNENYQPFSTEHTELEGLWDMDIDLNFFPSLFDLGSGVEWNESHSSAPKEPEQLANRIIGPPTPLTPAAMAEIYNDSRSPAIEEEAMEPRQYQPSSIYVDAQLSFPDMEDIAAEEVDQEDLAHVPTVMNSVIDQMTQLALTIEAKSTYPPFTELRIPPAPIINAWVQLYFEHFHPVFPFLHKPSFGNRDTHWLLIFAVSAIGAQFSGLPHSQDCSRAMNEMIRRAGSYLCENHNQNGRELWLTQAVVLNQMALRYSGERRALEVAELLQALPITLARRKRLFTTYLPHERVSHLDLPLDQKWQIWAIDEERRRTGFAIWLMDSAFESDFDLTTLMRVHEMQNSIPQEEKPWAASSAQIWAGFPARMTAKSSQNLLQLASDTGWTTTWNKTGVLGKSAILQQLLSIIEESRRQSLYCFSDTSVADCTVAVDALRQILAMTYDQGQELTSDLKALGAHRIIILSALMKSDLPETPLLSTVLKLKYNRYSNSELVRLKRKWSSSPQKTRQAVICAADLFETVRSTYCTHYSAPALLFQAVLVLWLYSSLLGQSQEFPSDAPSVIIGTANRSNTNQDQWVATGMGRVKIPGVGSFLSPLGLDNLLHHSISAMGSLKWWGISKIYLQLLTRLRAK